MRDTSTITDRRIGMEVRRLRLAHGLTQADIAGAIGIGASTVPLIEQGARRVKFTEALAFAELCSPGAPVAILAELAEAAVSGPSAPDQSFAEHVQVKRESVARTYLTAKSTGQPTTVAVAQLLGFSEDEAGKVRARQHIHVARSTGEMARVSREMDLEKFA